MDHSSGPSTDIMRTAIALAEQNVRGHSGGPFAAVIVRNGEIISRGVNRVTSDGDPTAHAEIVAIREACAHLNSHELSGLELYATCEPCPMCLGAIYWARLDRVYFAATRSDAAQVGFDDQRIYEEVNRPPADRSVPFTQLLRGESVRVLSAWRSDPERKPY